MEKTMFAMISMLVLILTLGGCASQKEMMVKEGYPPGYAEGYEDGCGSGNNAAGSVLDAFKKNVSRYERDSTYRQGWDDGFKQCKAKQDAFQRQYRNTVEQQRLEEEKRHNEKIEEKEILKGIDTSGLENYK